MSEIFHRKRLMAGGLLVQCSVVLVLFCIELGLALTVLPWLNVWTENSLLAGLPQLREFLGNYFVRGAFTGLGLIDIWIGIWEAVHYRDHPAE